MHGHKYTKEEIEFLKNNIKGITLKELTKKFNSQFNLNQTEIAIVNQKQKLGISSGIKGGQFQKGGIPWNKGTKGLMSKAPKNRKEIGSERVIQNGYIQVKTQQPDKWELKHRYIYEQHYGTIPKGYQVVFADQNKRNFDISNLILVSHSESMTMNRRKLIFKDEELTKTGLLIAKVINRASEIKKGNK